MNKKVVLLAATSLFLTVGVTAGVILVKQDNGGVFTKAKDDSYWFHYEQVTPTLTKHGSKEFWANCSTHNFSLENPGVGEDIREGADFSKTTYFDELTSEDPRYLPPLSERIDIKGHLEALLDSFKQDPYSFIPDTMRPEEVTKVTESEVTYDFTNFTNVSSIKYGGFGEQWHMVIENIKESERFYSVTTYGSEILGAANLLATSFLDTYYDNEVTKSFSSDARFTSVIDFHSNVLKYNIRYLSGITVPLFGEITPQIDMEYDVDNQQKTVRIQLGENNALKFVVTPDSYTFGLEYGIETVSRKAYFTVSKDENDAVEGHIYEYVQYKEKELMPACADFYIDETYASVVGNKAKAITGFAGYINELYKTNSGKLLGYKVRETFSKWGINKTYNTLWFNLNDILNINSVKAVSNGSVDPHENNHDIYLNGSSILFEPVRNKVLTVNTSRRYDVEIRKQFFYGYKNDELVEYETNIPMMFIQDNGDKSGETNYSTFENDILTKNNIAAKVMLSSTYLEKIRVDYLFLIDIFIQNKDLVDVSYIVDYIGSAIIY